MYGSCGSLLCCQSLWRYTITFSSIFVVDVVVVVDDDDDHDIIS